MSCIDKTMRVDDFAMHGQRVHRGAALPFAPLVVLEPLGNLVLIDPMKGEMLLPRDVFADERLTQN